MDSKKHDRRPTKQQSTNTKTSSTTTTTTSDDDDKKNSKTNNNNNNNKMKNKTKSGSGTGLNDMFIIVFGIAFLLSVSLNVLHATGNIDELPHEVPTAIHHAIQEFKNDKDIGISGGISGSGMKKMPKLPEDHEVEKDEGNHHDNSHHEEEGDVPREILLQQQKQHQSTTITTSSTIAHLNCAPYGGPPPELAQELIYWKDIPEDSRYVSPFYDDAEHEKFLTFEPDGGGWNNIRMAMESTIGLAIAMGRTLVMPPQKRMYLLGKGDKDQQKHFSFADFFPIYEMAKEFEEQQQQPGGSGAGFKVISMEEYLKRQAMTGKLRHKETGQVAFPPGNRTNWDGIAQKEYDELRGYLRNVTYLPLWKPGSCLPAFPSSRNNNNKDVAGLQELLRQARSNNNIPEGTPPVDVTDPNPLGRLEETLSGRKSLCVYDEELQSQTALHFQCNHKAKLRMLVHFYAFLFFESWTEDMWMKRFIRDHVRYIDEIQCAAARVVAGIRDHVRKRSGDPHGTFDTFHIRRGDFQFKTTRISAQEIYENSKTELTPNTTIFIATDERDKSFFDPLREHYDLLFLDDFGTDDDRGENNNVLKGVNTNYYGMIDQLVASKGRIFFGCWFSTFTGYINRLRGYHSTNLQLEGYEMGLLPTTYYYATIDRKFTMHEYAALRGGFFNREFPTAWRDIDKGIGMV